MGEGMAYIRYISHSTPVEVRGQLWELVLFSRRMEPNSYHQTWKQVTSPAETFLWFLLWFPKVQVVRNIRRLD